MTSQVEFLFFAKGVEIEPRKIHIFFRLTRIKPCQNRSEFFCMLGMNPLNTSRIIKRPQPLMFERYRHVPYV